MKIKSQRLSFNKNCINALLLTILFSTSIAQANNDALQKKVLRIATGEWPPYISETLANHGCLASMVQQAYALQGYEIEFEFFPWGRAYNESLEGHYHATAYWFDSENKRKTFLFPKNHITLENSYMYSLKGSGLEFNSFDDLDGKKVVINIGYTYSDLFFSEARKRNVELISVANEIQSFKLLLAKRADYAIISERPADFYLNHLPEDFKKNIKKSKEFAISSKGHLLISKNIKSAESIRDAFDKGFEELMSNNEYKEKYKQNCSEY